MAETYLLFVGNNRYELDFLHAGRRAAQDSSRAHMGLRHAGAAAPVGLALSLGRLWGAAVLPWGCAAQTGRC